MGCIIKDTDKGIKVTGPKNAEYEGIDVDMNDFSDQAMTMAVLAIFASSPTRIRNIQHIKHQETNRISATINELTKLGIKVDETDDGIIIYPSTPKTASIETYEDHRMAMAFSLVGLRVEGIVIKNPGCVSKTFETYFSELDKVIKAHT